MPPLRSSLEPLEFAAPIGRRVRVVTAVSVGIILLAMAGNLFLHTWLDLPVRSRAPMVLAPLAGVVVIAPIGYFARILRYRITVDALEVIRPGRINRFALAGLQSAEADRHALDWSIKVFGNSGLGAITGRFRDSRIGPYQALVTDRERAVVLRWPERTLVVSPDRPEEFAERILARAAGRK